ncbi:MAG: CHAT domain-containing protein, partial [Synechococcales cyanobacterium CRU_2_2]|nr:CHAT domain-containing protein [Synechococcales cyanobacterium CRU_2_2]
VAFQAQPLYFPALPHVAEELGGMKQAMPSSDTLLDSDFTLGRVRQELGRTEPATQVLHLATHTRFGFDGRQTFLVTGRPESLTNFSAVPRNQAEQRQVERQPDEGWFVPTALGGQNRDAEVIRVAQAPEVSSGVLDADARLEAISLERLSSEAINGKLTLARMQALSVGSAQPLELLTLSACQTATGSDRDILGIAGIAIQSGIGSTVASLWLVEDEATAIMMPQFYRHWEAGEGRASALQSMQKDWLSKTQNSPYRHPGYWAPFILVGNWL